MSRQPSWSLVAVSLVFAVAATITSMLHANRVAQESNRMWCGVVVTLDEAYQQTPPQTPTGRELAASIHKLRRDFRCPPLGELRRQLDK